MTLLGCLFVLIGVICCSAAPASEAKPSTGSCKAPPRFPDKELLGEWNTEYYDPGKRAQYNCRPGFIRLGSIQFVCSEGQWIPVGTSGQCKKKSCGHPGDIDFGTFELKKEEEFVFGAIVEYTCNDGYQMISKHRTRECTATGWSNHQPECEVRYCPPVQVDSNVNLLSTSYEEEYSVGQVIRFECKNAKQKLIGVSEIFCTSEGEWNEFPPTCEEISCRPPVINNGKVNNPRSRYNDQETLDFSCNSGYKPSTSPQLTCTKNDWRPMPLCEEIVCYPEFTKNGKVEYTKETYKEGETVALKCDEGYQIEHKPEELRICTAHGWSPSLKCISKKCDSPKIINGDFNTYYYRFPMNPGKSLSFTCKYGFLTSEKSYYGTTYCTKNGWRVEPKCFRSCNTPSEHTINAYIQHSAYPYIEGQKLTIQCYQGFATPNGQLTGTIECLPDGSFVGDKCSKTCRKPNLSNGELKQNLNVFQDGAHLLYECNEGFISSDKKLEGKSQCSNNAWYPEPACNEIKCTIETKTETITVKSGGVVHLKCPNYTILEGSDSIQCFYYGWGPALPVCKGRFQDSPVSVDRVGPSEFNCPPASAPPNGHVIHQKDEYLNGDEIEISCDPGYLLYGSKTILCKDGKWQSPPWCIEKIRCNSSPPRINMGKIIKETLADQYYTGSTVKYICENGYHIIGSDENKCIDGNWLPPPTCVENSCGSPEEIEHGKAQGDKTEYKHGENVAYKCSLGYSLTGSRAAVCLRGKWQEVPRCIYSSCGPPPDVANGKARGKKATYLKGERVNYDCANGFTVGQNADYIICEDSAWTEPPVCRRIGQTCGSPPVVQYGDIIDIKRMSYPSGSSVRYKCAQYYKLEGKEILTCRDGEWDKEPVCRVPCTVTESDMQQNNIRFLHKYGQDKTKKLYSEHFDNMTFECTPQFEISDRNLLRIQCLDGVLKYPKCLKKGFCTLQLTEMAHNNIYYNKSTDIENGQTIEFECEEGMVPEKSLTATCKNKRITYPKCSSGRPCLPPRILHGTVSPQKEDNYESGSSVDITCDETYVLNGRISVKCENGEWDELPQCFKPCTISASSLDKNNIELTSSESISKILLHGTEVNVKCKANFKRPGALIASCYNGTVKYPRCFSSGTCRIIQQQLDDNSLELGEVHENEVFYEEGETVHFKCKSGYRNNNELTGKCTKKDEKAEYELNYPTCTLEESAV